MKYRQVDVWYTEIDKWAARADVMRGWLSSPERVRAAAYRFESDAAAYVVSHAMLRSLLARYIGKPDPRDVMLRTGRQGRPRLALPQALKGHRFSLSRSHSLAVLAVTRLGHLGVDVEMSSGTGDIGDGQMSMREWVRRESAIKALGGTLDDIHRYEVGGESPLSVRAHMFGRAVDVHDLFVSPAYEIAVAVPPGSALVLAGEWQPWRHHEFRPVHRVRC